MSVYAKADIARRVMASAMEPSGTHLRRDGRREVAANNSAGNSSVPFDRDRRLTLANPERMALNTVSESGFRREQVVLRSGYSQPATYCGTCQFRSAQGDGKTPSGHRLR